MNGISRYFQSIGIIGLVATFALTVMFPLGDYLQAVRLTYLLANAALFAYVISNSRRGGLAFMIAFFFFLLIAIPANLQVGTGVFPFNSSYSAGDILPGYAILALAQLSYYLGEFFIDVRRRETYGRSRPPLNPRFIRRATILMIVLTLPIVMVVGPSRLFLNCEETVTEFAANDGIQQQILFVGGSLTLVALLLATHLVTTAQGGKRPGRDWLLLVVAFFAALIVNFPTALPRFQLLGIVLAVLVLATNMFSRGMKLFFAGGSIVFLFFLFPAIKVLGQGGSVDFIAAFGRDVSEYLLRVDFDGFKLTVDTLIYSSDHPLRYGENFLGAALFWVPRGLWPNKPVDSGYIVSSTLGYSYNNVSNPLPAEGYVSFGVVGTVAVMLLLGLFVTAIEARALGAQQTLELRLDVILYAMSTGFVVILLRGSLNGVAPMFMTAFLIYGLLVVASKRSERRVASNDRRFHGNRRSEGRHVVSSGGSAVG